MDAIQFYGLDDLLEYASALPTRAIFVVSRLTYATSGLVYQLYVSRWRCHIKLFRGVNKLQIVRLLVVQCYFFYLTNNPLVHMTYAT